MKFIKLPNKKIKEKILLWRSIWFVGLFCLSVLLLVAMISSLIPKTILFISSLPLIFILLTAQQEENYLKFLLQIREKGEE